MNPVNISCVVNFEVNTTDRFASRYLGVSRGVVKCSRAIFCAQKHNGNIAVYREGTNPKPWFLRFRFTKCVINNEIVWFNTNSFCKRFDLKKSSSTMVYEKLSSFSKGAGIPKLQWDSKNGNRPFLINGDYTYIFRTKTRNKDPVLGKGSFKTAKIAERYFQGVPQSDAVVLIARGDFQDLEREVKIMKKLQGVLFILQLLVDTQAYSRKKPELSKYYMVVEKGTDLWKVVSEKSSILDKAKHSYQMAAALAAVHEKQMIHRDVKLNNFILLDNGEIALSDFGATCEEGEKDDELTKYVTTYPAPEQAQSYQKKQESLSDPRCVTSKVDSWGLGVALYDMHKKDRADFFFRSADDWLQILESTKNLRQDQIEEKLKQIPDEKYRRIIGELLQIDPAKRMSTQEAAEGLQVQPGS